MASPNDTHGLAHGLPLGLIEGYEYDSNGIDFSNAYIRALASGVKSTLNSSNVIVSDGETWEGVSELNNYPDFLVVCQTDQDGELNIQFSLDGENWSNYPSSGFIVRAGINKVHKAVKAPRYFRVTFKNSSGSEQTYFRLAVFFGEFSDLTAPLNQSIGVDSDAKAVRPTDFRYEVAEGLRGGASTWNKWGKSTITSGSFNTIWTESTDLVRMTTAATIDISSSSASDTSAGVGAQSLILYGVGDGYIEQTEVISLNGTSTVTTAKTWLGFNRVAIYLAGSNGFNVGKITLQTSGGDIQATIPVEEGSSQHAFFFIPANRNGLMDWLWVNAAKDTGGGNPVLSIKSIVTSLVSGAKYNVFDAVLDTQRQSDLPVSPSQPFLVGEKSLIEFQGESSGASIITNLRFSLITKQIA